MIPETLPPAGAPQPTPLSSPAVLYQAFLSYSHADAAFATALVDLLRRGGFDVWLDEERMRGGRAVQDQLLAAMSRSSAALFLITEAWLESNYCQWEVEAFDERYGRARLMIPLMRIPRQVSSLPPTLVRAKAVPWMRAEPTEALFWLLRCALYDDDPGPELHWENEGRRALGSRGGNRVRRPVRRNPGLEEEAAHRARFGYAQAALQCNRDEQWQEVNIHAALPQHEALLVQGRRKEAPDLFLEAVERCLPEHPPRDIVSVPWDPPPRTEGDLRQDLAGALGCDDEADLAWALRDRLRNRNLVLVHRPVLATALEEEPLLSYYREILPGLLPQREGGRGFLKVVQGIESGPWAPCFFAPLAHRVWPFRAAWIERALEWNEARRLAKKIAGLSNARFPVFLLPHLRRITRRHVEQWSRRLEPGIDRAAAVREVLRGARSSAEILARAARLFGPREETA